MAERADAGSADGGLKCNLDDCIYCGLCAKNCPCDALTVDRKEKVWKVDTDACVECGACIEKCPKKCLSLGGEAAAEEAPADKKDAGEKAEEAAEPEYSCPEGEEGLRCKVSELYLLRTVTKRCPARCAESGPQGKKLGSRQRCLHFLRSLRGQVPERMPGARFKTEHNPRAYCEGAAASFLTAAAPPGGNMGGRPAPCVRF